VRLATVRAFPTSIFNIPFVNGIIRGKSGTDLVVNIRFLDWGRVKIG
jgi:hypothetical protein